VGGAETKGAAGETRRRRIGRKTLSAYGGYIVETFVTLVAVCAIAFVVLYGAKRLGMGRASGAIQLVGQLPLDARRSIYLVKVGGQVLVVGVGEGGFTKLAEMPESALPADALAGSARATTAPRMFADVLAALGKRGGVQPSADKPAGPDKGSSS